MTDERLIREFHPVDLMDKAIGVFAVVIWAVLLCVVST